jgi:hypothetical protein
LQDLGDHFQMSAVSGILVHQVGEISGRDIEALREQPRNQKRDGRLIVEK